MNDLSLEQKVIQAALSEMFGKGYFSICTIDNCLDILKIPQGGPTYKLLRTLHCVHFAGMDRELAKAVPGMISEVLTGISFDVLECMPKRSGRIPAPPPPPAVREIREDRGQPERRAATDVQFREESAAGRVLRFLGMTR